MSEQLELWIPCEEHGFCDPHWWPERLEGVWCPGGRLALRSELIEALEGMDGVQIQGDYELEGFRLLTIAVKLGTPCIHADQGHIGEHWVYPNGETDKAFLCRGGS